MNKKLFLLYAYGAVSLGYAMEQEVMKSKKVGIFSEINQRKEQEDRFYHGMVDGGNLFAVFDGHLGADVADFLAKNFHLYFQKTSGNTMRERMIKTFKNVDNDEAIKKNKHCGSTAAIVFIKDNMAHFAHVGDSRAVLEIGGAVAYATRDHRPDRADEYVRIEDVKGAQFVDEMKNFLILSRSFGDYGFNKDIMISDPDYEEIKLTEHKFLVLATDGLWRVMKNEEAINMLHVKRSQDHDIHLLAKMLGEFAKQSNSQDNITVMVVDLLSQ